MRVLRVLLTGTMLMTCAALAQAQSCPTNRTQLTAKQLWAGYNGSHFWSRKNPEFVWTAVSCKLTPPEFNDVLEICNKDGHADRRCSEVGLKFLNDYSQHLRSS